MQRRRRGPGRSGGDEDGDSHDEDGSDRGGDGGNGGRRGGGNGDGGGGGYPGSPPRNNEGTGILQGMEGVVIWGTNVNVNESMARFRQFLLEFCLDDEDEPLYRSQLEEIHRTQVRKGGLVTLHPRWYRSLIAAVTLAVGPPYPHAIELGGSSLS